MSQCKNAVIVFLGILLVAAAARAQVDKGTITGIVADTSGAAVPNAEVTVNHCACLLSIRVGTEGKHKN